MIKLASIALIPVLAATFYPPDQTQDTLPPVPRVNWAQAQVQQEDQSFLDTLREEAREQALVERIAAQKADQQVDQEFLINLQEEDLIPVRKAIAVDRSIPADPWADAVRKGREVRRAIPVNESTVITKTSVTPPAPFAL